MKKVLALMMCSVIICGCAAHTYAAVAVEETTISETAKDLTGTTTTTIQPIYKLDGATVALEDGTEVTLADESIDALAKAIADASADDGITVTDKLGNSYEVHKKLVEYWGDYTYHVLATQGTVYYWVFCNTAPTVSADGFIVFTGTVQRVMTYALGASAMSYASGEINGMSFSVSEVLYSDCDIYNDDGTLYYSSDTAPYVPVTYTVSFVTGFDDILLESQTWTEEFVPGTLSYDGYTFDGWYMDAEYTTPYTSDYVPEADFTLYAKWFENGPMDLFHNSLFSALEALFACEPIRYLLALIILVILIGVIKSRRSL